METNKIYFGKMEEVLPQLCPDNIFDSLVMDPPYGLKFMGKKWDYSVPTVDQWREAYRVLKPGGYLLAFGGTRTYHRLVVNIEDAGFEIRDQMQWIYGEGFPKSMAIDKQLVVDSDEAKQWQGWGTALKPAHEPIVMARKPISEPTIAANILKWGTGGIYIDGCRIAFEDEEDYQSAIWGRGTDILGGNYVGGTHSSGKTNIEANKLGRWPGNVIMDAEAGAMLDHQYPSAGAFAPVNNRNSEKTGGIYGNYKPVVDEGASFQNDKGGPSRFFYCPKPDSFERDKGLNKFDLKETGVKNDSGRGYSERDPYKKIMRRNNHPTVKPISLMRYLVKLVTPKGGLCGDFFCGSGTTLAGCKMELINYVGITDDQEHVELSEARVAAWNPDLYKPQQLF